MINDVREKLTSSRGSAADAFIAAGPVEKELRTGDYAMKKVSQVLSVTLSAALALTSTPWTAFAAGPVGMSAPAFVNAFTPAEKLGYVASSYSPDANAKHPRLVIVSDLHGHVEVQRNIMGIIDKVVNKLRGDGASKAVPVFVEGGWTSNLEEPLRVVANGNTRTFLREYYLQKAEMSAAQAYSEQVAGSGKVSVIGVEDEKEYKANKAEFAKSYEARRRLLQALELQELSLKKLSNAISNDSFEALHQAREDYFAGRLSSDQYAKLLAHKAIRRKVASSYVETLKNASTANADTLEFALEETYRQVVTSVAAKAPLSAMLQPSLGDDRTLRVQVARSDADLDILKRLVSNQLTPAEVPVAMNRMPALIQLAKALLGKDAEKLNIENVVRESLDFYPYAIMRNESLAKNSIANLDRMGADTTGILVVGGFHSQAITDYLRAHHISYMEINPTITRDETAQEELNYVKRVCDQHITPKELDNDLKWLRGEQHRQEAAGSATAVHSDLEQGNPGPGDVQKFVAGVTPTALAVMAQEGPVLAKTIALAAQQTGLVFAAEDASVVAQREKTIESKIKAAAKKEESLAGLDLTGPSLTLRRNADGQWTANGHASPYWEQLANSILDEESNQGVEVLHIKMLKDSDTEKLGGKGAVFGNIKTDKELVIGLTEKRFVPIEKLSVKDKLDPEQRALAMRAIHVFGHELRHALTRTTAERTQNGEAKAFREGIAAAVVMGLHQFKAAPGADGTRDLVFEILTAISPDVNGVLGNWDAQLPDLAERIAKVIDPALGRDAQIKRIVAELRTSFPDIDEKVMALQADQLENDQVARMIGGQSDGKLKAGLTWIFQGLRKSRQTLRNA
jgi:hypothetical protein